jgi:hypothetical protein
MAERFRHRIRSDQVVGLRKRHAPQRIIAGNGDEEAFKLFDQEYWDVDSINFSGGKLFGVFVSGKVEFFTIFT